MRAQLKPRQLDALEPREATYEVFIGPPEGLYVRVWRRTGVKSFRLRYRIDGKRKWITIGEYPRIGLSKARAEARRVLGLVATGRDPAAEAQAAKRQRRAVGSVSDVVERYLDEYARPRKRSAAEDERVLRKELLPRYGQLPARDLTRGHVLEILNDARARGVEGGLNNILAIIRRMCRWALAQEILAANPCLGIERPAALKQRERVLSREELGIYWTLLADASCDYKTRLALQIQCLTGLRIGEVVGAGVLEVQLAERKFVIGQDRMKAKRPHVVPLTSTAVELFEMALDLAPEGSVYVFPNADGTEPIRSRSVVRALQRMQPTFGFAKPFTSHDVRRTCATMLIEDHVQPAVVDRVLAHAPAGVLDRHYNVASYQQEKREALEHWESVVLGAATSSEMVR